MKALFIALQTLKDDSGISKKIISQNEALCSNGVVSKLVSLSEMHTDGTYNLLIDNKKICSTIFPRFYNYKNYFYRYKYHFIIIEQYVKKNNIDFIYFRYTHTADSLLLKFYKRINSLGCKIIIEIPTYPYDGEYKNCKWTTKIRLMIERIYRKKFYKYVYRIVTFSNDDYIFNCKTIKIDNGVNIDNIPLKQKSIKTDNTLNMIGVANLMIWHGFDRVIEGLHNYYKQEQPVRVVFNIISPEAEVEKQLRALVKQYDLEQHVIFCGSKVGRDLDAMFDKNDIAIGCLGCHRKNIVAVKSIKNVEYAARGIPFIYSENNDNFDNMPYILKVSADEMPIDINSIIKFYDSTNWNPIDIRNSIADTLSWKKQMEKVLCFF